MSGCGRPACAQLRSEGKCGVDQFKDAVCGYDGPETWCDRTRERCAQLGNLGRFDGALPPVKAPWEVPWWDVVGGAGMVATAIWGPAWGVAGPLYFFFCCLILPPVREEIYLHYLRRTSADRTKAP